MHPSRIKALLKWLALALSVVSLLASCAPSATPTPTPRPTPTFVSMLTPTPRPTPTPIKGEGQVVVFGQGAWEKWLGDLFIAKFEKESGCKVTYFGGLSSAMLARIKAEAGRPTVDIVNMDLAPQTDAKMMGLLEKNNRDILSNLEFVHPKLLDPDDMGIPFIMLGGPVIAVRHDKLKERNLPMPESWLDVANPAYKGRVGITVITATATQNFVALIARALGGNEVNDYVRAFDWVESKLAPNVMAVVAVAEWQKLLEEGSIWVGVGTWGRAAESAYRGIPVTLVWAKEGNNIDLNNLVVVKGASNPVCAQLWMNYALSKEVQDAIPEGLLRGPVRSDVAISEKVKDLVIKPADIDRAVELNRDALAKNLPDWVDRWTRIFGK